MQTHDMFDGRLQVYKRGESRFWQCAARVGTQRFRNSTKEEDLSRAKDVAEEWYLSLRGMMRNGELVKKERTFADAAEHYLRHARVLAVSVRSPKYIEYMELRMRRHSQRGRLRLPRQRENVGKFGLEEGELGHASPPFPSCSSRL